MRYSIGDGQMGNQNEKEQREQEASIAYTAGNAGDRQHAEDKAFGRCITWLCGGVATELLVLLIRRFYVKYTMGEINFAAALHQAFPVCAGVAAALLVVCAFWFAAARKKGGSGLAPGILVAVFGVLAVVLSVFARFDAAGAAVLLAAVPGVTVLMMIYYLYQKEFFLACVASGAGMLFLWCCHKLSWSYRLYVVMGILLAVIALAAIVTAVICKGNGVITLGGKRIRVFSKQASGAPVYLAAAITAVLMILAVALGATAAYYAMFAQVALVFVLAVYYTVKLM